MEEVQHGTRKRGRPKLRWRDGVARDPNNLLDVWNWMVAGQDGSARNRLGAIKEEEE